MTMVKRLIDILIQIAREEMDEPDFDEAIKIMGTDFDIFPDLTQQVVMKLAFKSEFDPETE